jgi:16S rRNA (cytidine1402-2'-O)-methyltransferase
MSTEPPIDSALDSVSDALRAEGMHNAVLNGLRVAASDAAGQHYPTSTLYVIATPIGNRADITVRALACLARVDAVAAEDTRTARQLLNHYGIDKPMIAAHRHNENEAATALVTRIAGGARIAYVSDAGTPGVSDPGARLVAAVREAGLRVIPIPGASALTTALSAAGLAEGPVQFVGFLPAKSAQAANALKALSTTSAHLVFYEAPHRIVETLTLIADAFDGRACVIARELTKRFETIHRCAASEAVAWITADPQRQRGEFVVIVEADASEEQQADRAMAKAMPILEKLCAALSVSEAASLTAEITGVSRKALYAEALKLKGDALGPPNPSPSQPPP